MPLKDKEARKRYRQIHYLLHRDCERASRRAYYMKMRDRYLDLAKDRYAHKKDEIDEYTRNYVMVNQEKVRERRRRYYVTHTQDIKAKLANTLERRRAVKRAWVEKNADHIRVYRLAYWPKVYQSFKNSLHKKLAHGLRLRLRIAMKRIRNAQPIKKAGSAVVLLGCTIQELIGYIETRFQPGMSWKNRSRWHIDHIRPLSKFDLQDPEDLAQACHYTNLQPLWSIENIKKGAR